MNLTDSTEAEHLSEISNDCFEYKTDFYEKVNVRNNYMKLLYLKAKESKVGDEIICPACRKKIIKTSYQQAFCKPIITKNKKKRYACKDRYHNTVDISRWRNIP